MLEGLQEAPRAALERKPSIETNRHSTHNDFKVRRKVVSVENTEFPLPTLLSAGYSREADL